jgi:hypothetical protein
MTTARQEIIAERRFAIALALGLFGLLLHAFVPAHAGALAPVKELSLCYDKARWPETQRVAKRGGVIVLNPNEGRGSKPKPWDDLGAQLRKAGGKTLGYVDMKDTHSKRKPSVAILAECTAWLNAGHSGVFLDDATDNGADADVIRDVQRAKPAAMIIANPGCRVSGALKATNAILCESEYPDTINYDSAVIIAFVRDADAANAARWKAKPGTILALEPRDSYHKPGVEFQQKNPFIP